MIILLFISIVIVGIYLLYPLFLKLFCSCKTDYTIDKNKNKGISLILLLYNGKDYLKAKIEFLLKELSYFEEYELIVIDDNSRDGSTKLFDEYLDDDRIKIIQKKQHSGIPNSMNLGVKNASYEYIIFCDQRQHLAKGSLSKIIEPLKYNEVGAVSGCLSSLDKDKNDSFLRQHENDIKCNESKSGNLIGVYGPFYAIKKNCYSTIPDDIILDDLYLSLRILKSKCVVMVNGNAIIDDNFSKLYNYTRTKRYLTGLIQILTEKNLISELSGKQKIMLLWHKFFRLLIPPVFVLCYLLLSLNLSSPLYAVVFVFLSLLFVGAFIQMFLQFPSRLISVIWINMLYFIAFIDILLNKIFPVDNLKNTRTVNSLHENNEAIQTKLNY